MSVSVSSECRTLDSNEELTSESEKKRRPEKVKAIVQNEDTIQASAEEYADLMLVVITDGFCRGKLIGELSEKDLIGAYYSGCLRRAESRGKKECFVRLKRFVEHFHTVYRESDDFSKPAICPEAIPSGKHKGKRLGDLPDHVLMAMQGSWVDVSRLRTSAFFETIQAEVRRRHLHVVELSEEAKTRAKSAKRSRAIIEAELKNLCGGSIPDDKRQLLHELLSGI